MAIGDRHGLLVDVIQGTLDMITPMDHALWMERALREAGNPHVRVVSFAIMQSLGSSRLFRPGV